MFEREQFPMILLFWKPPSNITTNTLYSSTRNRLVTALEIMKVFDVDNPEQLTHDWLMSKLKK
jgi:hypothetical protein